MPFEEHECTLSVEEEVKISKYRSFFNKWFLIYDENPLCKSYFHSHKQIRDERKRHIDSDFRYIIHPLSKFRLHWNRFIIILYIISMFTIPYDVAFNPLPGTRRRNPIAMCSIINEIFCFFFICNIIVTCLTGYVSYKTRTTVLNQWKILLNYVRTYYIFDLLSSFPVNTIHGILTNEEAISKLYLSYIYLFRLFHLITIYNYFDQDKQTRGYTFRLLKVLSVFIIGLHWGGCIKFICYKCLLPYFGADRRNWVSLIMTKLSNGTDANNGTEMERLNIYFVSLFNAMEILLFDVAESSYLSLAAEDVMINFIFRVFGIFYLAFQMASLINILMIRDAKSRKYLEKMNHLQEYMRNKEFPMYLQDRLILFYEYRYQKKYFREWVTTAPLTSRLKKEISRYKIYQVIKSVKLLSELSDNVLKKIIDIIRPEIFLPGDILMKAGNTAECVFFLVHGTVAMYTINGREICHFEDGDYFGIISLVMPEHKRMTTGIALEVCRIFRIDKRTFNVCFPANSYLYEIILQTALTRLKQVIAAEQKQRLYIIESSNNKTT